MRLSQFLLEDYKKHGIAGYFGLPKTHPLDVLSKEDENNIDTYKGSLSFKINRHLRNRSEQTDESPQVLQPYIDSLNHVIQNHRTIKPFVVHRAIRRMTEDVDDFLSHVHKNVGKVIRIPGFQSTTTLPKQAHGYTDLTEKHILRINIPKGVPAYDIDRHGLSLRKEHEIILPHNARYKIHRIEKVNTTKPNQYDPKTRFSDYPLTVYHMSYLGI